MSRVDFDTIRYDFNNDPALSMLEPEEEYALGMTVKEHDCERSRNRLVTSHLRYASKIAVDYAKKYGKPFADLQQEASIGLMQAAKKFDPEKVYKNSKGEERRVRFVTYAAWWIRASVQDYLMKNHSMVKYGTTSAQKKIFFNLRRVLAKIERENPEILDMQVDILAAEELGVTTEEVKQGRQRLISDASLNTPVSNDGDEGREFMDILEDENALSGDQVAESKDFIDSARDAFSNAVAATLNDR